MRRDPGNYFRVKFLWEVLVSNLTGFKANMWGLWNCCRGRFHAAEMHPPYFTYYSIIKLSVSSYQHSLSWVNSWSRKVRKDCLLVLGNCLLPKNVENKKCTLLLDDLTLALLWVFSSQRIKLDLPRDTLYTLVKSQNQTVKRWMHSLRAGTIKYLFIGRSILVRNLLIQWWEVTFEAEIWYVEIRWQDLKRLESFFNQPKVGWVPTICRACVLFLRRHYDYRQAD